MASPKSDLPQGTLDLLILKAVALGTVHGYAIARLFIRPCTAWKRANFWRRNGGRPRPGATPSSIA